MGRKTDIEWTESTWNPFTGCNHISKGCDHCYAERMAARLKAMGVKRYNNGFRLTLHEDLYQLPLSWKEPRMIFVNSMSDLFHDQVPSEAIEKIFWTMKEAHWHILQILTKRPARLARLAPDLEWPVNIWMGVSVESSQYTSRVEILRGAPASTRFISFEPLLSSIPETTSLQGIDWAIVGGESGPGARPMEEEWVTGIRDLCRRDNTAFFFKQWGGFNKKAAGRTLEGRIWDEMPAKANVSISI